MTGGKSLQSLQHDPSVALCVLRRPDARQGASSCCKSSDFVTGAACKYSGHVRFTGRAKKGGKSAAASCHCPSPSRRIPQHLARGRTLRAGLQGSRVRGQLQQTVTQTHPATLQVVTDCAPCVATSKRVAPSSLIADPSASTSSPCGDKRTPAADTQAAWLIAAVSSNSSTKSSCTPSMPSSPPS